MNNDPFDAWPMRILTGMAVFVALFMMEHMHLFSTPPTRAAYLWIMEAVFH